MQMFSHLVKVLQEYSLWSPLCLIFTVLLDFDSIVHYNEVIMSAMASQNASLTIVYSTVYSRCRSKKTSKLRVTGLCVGNSLVTGEFPAQKASNAENVSIWWRHHDQNMHRLCMLVNNAFNSLRPHICVSKLTIVGSDNGLSPDRHQAIIWTNAGILSIGPLGTKLSEILIAIHKFPS